MDKRYWYALDRWVSPLGLGCWQLAGNHSVDGKPHGWGPVEEPDAIGLVHAALDSGVQFFDTAAGYGLGRSEEILGKALATSANGGHAVICTKIPLTEAEAARHGFDDDFTEKLERSLQRLNRERIDILLLHNPPDNTDWERFDKQILEKLQQQGKIGTFGVSTRGLAGAMNIAAAGFGTCIEWVFNLLERRPAEQLFAKLEAAKMNFIARSPLSRGLLSPKYIKHDPVFGEDDFRSTLDPDWVRWVIGSIRGLELQEQEANNISNLALQYCLGYKDVSAVIPGIKTISQLQSYLEAMNEKMDAGFLSRLHARTATAYPAWT